jgi:hypothetical protein
MYPHAVLRRPVRRVVTAALLAAASALAACGGKKSSPTAPADASGTYALVSIDGHALPAPITANGQNVSDAKSGSLTLATDHTFDISFVVTATGHDSTVAATGSYTRIENSLFLSTTVDGLSGTLQGTVTPTGIEQQLYFAGGTHMSLFRR